MKSLIKEMLIFIFLVTSISGLGNTEVKADDFGAVAYIEFSARDRGLSWGVKVLNDSFYAGDERVDQKDAEPVTALQLAFNRLQDSSLFGLQFGYLDRLLQKQ